MWLLHGSRADLEVMTAPQDLEIPAQTAAQLEELESLQVTVTGIVLSPRTTLAGRVLGELRFRDRFGLTVLAVWREGRPYRSELHLLVMGPGGYRFADYVRVGGPMTLVAFVVIMLLVPLMWPP